MSQNTSLPSAVGNTWIDRTRQDVAGDTRHHVETRIGYTFEEPNHHLRQALRLATFIPPEARTPHNNNEILARIGSRVVELICLLHLKHNGYSIAHIIVESYNHQRVTTAIGNSIAKSDIPAYSARDNLCEGMTLNERDHEKLGHALIAAVFLDSGCQTSKSEHVLRVMGVSTLPPRPVSPLPPPISPLSSPSMSDLEDDEAADGSHVARHHIDDVEYGSF